MPRNNPWGNLTFDPDNMALTPKGYVYFMRDGNIYSMPKNCFNGVGFSKPIIMNRVLITVGPLTFHITPLPGKEQEVRRWAARMNLMSSKQRVVIKGGESG